MSELQEPRPPEDPIFYRYEVAFPARRGPRLMLNRYGRRVIGVAVVVGRYAYCCTWGRP